MAAITGQDQWAIFLAAVCGQTYDQYSSADGSFVVPINYRVHYTIEAKSINNEWERFGFILESDQNIIIAFRGTSSRTDWVSDMIASQKKFPYILEDTLTHRGFLDIYSSARLGIVAALSRMSPDKSLIVTGHSLGAALATLCAIDMAVNTPYTSPNLYTYGSPRVGDPDFTKAFKQYVQNSYRYANILDIVTHAPPPIYKLPKRMKKYYYQHVQSLSTLSFNNGSISANHIISSYFKDISKREPKFTELLCTTNPGFCPVVIPKSKG